VKTDNNATLNPVGCNATKVNLEQGSQTAGRVFETTDLEFLSSRVATAAISILLGNKRLKFMLVFLLKHPLKISWYSHVLCGSP